MIITSTVTRDNGLLDRIRSVARNATAKIEVGYFGNQMHKPSITSGSTGQARSSISIKDLAAIHELGLGVPKRPFVAPALNKNRANYIKYVGRQITPIIRRRQSMNATWQTVGVMAVADIQKYMVTAKFTPLAPSTIKRKGSSKPLIDTGQMRQAITYRVK
ncbi:hypothetical protein ACS8E2_12760 [Psychrobacter glaciei]|uniref:hypothetical protein n=1 Tax=Psychrobacter glaciei TaxID=619771 RepID=UPI003F456E48